jgi:hypothetical protein
MTLGLLLKGKKGQAIIIVEKGNYCETNCIINYKEYILLNFHQSGFNPTY